MKIEFRFYLKLSVYQSFGKSLIGKYSYNKYFAHQKYISVSPLVQSKATGKLSPSLGQMRTQIDIMANILNEAAEGTRKTRIMYGCNLSYRQLQSYLKLLVGMKLLSATSENKSSKTTFFETTAKGQNFLLAYRKLKALMASSSSR